MQAVVLGLTWLDVIFLFLSIVSVGWNVVQYIERRRMFRPVKSNLIALFNDAKGKALFAYQIQNTLFSGNNPHQDIETLRWEYAHFCQAMISSLQGLQESIIGVLVAVDPSDREGLEAFRASNYGLTDEEKNLRQKNLDQWFSQHSQPNQVDAADPEASSSARPAVPRR